VLVLVILIIILILILIDSLNSKDCFGEPPKPTGEPPVRQSSGQALCSPD
jgi:hypothetical protein